MKNILFITNANLLPNTNGAVINSYGLIKFLKEKGNNLTLINFYINEPNDKIHLQELREYCDDIHQVKLKRPQYWKNISIKYPVTIKKYYRKEMIKILQNISNKHIFDIAIYDHLHTAIYKKYVKTKKHILFEHNIESTVWKSYLKTSKSIFKILVYLQYILMTIFERKIIKSIRNIFVVALEDSKEILKFDKELNVFLLKPKIYSERVKKENDVRITKNNILFLGSYSWFPNQEAARILAIQLMPLLREKMSGIKLFLVGSNPTSEMKEYDKNFEDIIVTGEVDSVDPFIIDSDIFVNAVESGGGLNIKIVEAMAKGIPIISSRFGSRGLSITNNKQILIYESIPQLCNQILMLLKNPNKRLDLSNESLTYFIENIKNDEMLTYFLNNTLV